MKLVADDPDRERFPEIERRIGEDPARWLDRDLVERGPSHTTRTNRELVLARIRGIDYLGVANAWIQVERELDRGPRDRVIETLEERRDFLIEYGDRPEVDEEELEERRAQYNDESDEDTVVWRHEPCGSTDVEQDSSMAWFCHTCDQRTNRVERVDEAADAERESAVATDGGDSTA